VPNLLFVQQRQQFREDCAGDDLGAYGSGVNAVLLDGAGNVNEVLVDHGDERNSVFGGEVAEDLIEGLDVIGAVVRRQSDASQKNSDVCTLKSGEDSVEVLTSLIGG